jgi:NAD(P) transhydrogenase subunit alpha
MIVVAATAESGGETRVALSPETAKKFKSLGCEVRFQAGAGRLSHFPDKAYEEAGAAIVPSAGAALDGADIVLKVRRPSAEELAAMKPGTVVAAILDPYGGGEAIDALARSGVNAFSMEFIPRITRAQSMDVLSSQANLAGYKAVVDAAAHFSRALPMMMTAAGTVPAARIFIMGVGVAGLQAIATARRLGAIVTATDVRPATKEQVESLGAKFVAVINDEFKQAETAGGYAKEMSDDYKRQQAELVASHITNQDIIITTALIPGRPAPKLLTRPMIESMKPGSIIVDLAAERGGNAELTKPGETAEHNGVTIMGPINLAGEVSGNASSLYARNLYAFIEPMIDKKDSMLKIDWNDDIIKGTALTRDGQIIHPSLTGAKA